MLLEAYIEIEGKSILFGTIDNGCFSYDSGYVREHGRPVSLSMPVEKGTFTERETNNYFNGLLPEGFTRSSVARYLNTDESDYLTMLSYLGRECIGAIRIAEPGDEAGTPQYIRISDDEVRRLAAEGQSASADMVVKSHLSLAGASGKVGLYYDGEGNWYLPLRTAPSTHIVKQSHVRFERLVANERLAMLTAAKLGIDVPESFVVNTGSGNDDEVLLATRRYDRLSVNKGLSMPGRLHQEDFCQALGIPASEKYERNGEGYLKRMLDVIEKYSSSPLSDMFELWNRVVFNYLIGNNDGHIKNFSLLYSPDLKSVRLAPAYDLVSTCIYGGTGSEMSIAVNKKRNINEINRDDFEAESEILHIGSGIAMKHYDEMDRNFEGALMEAASEMKEEGIADGEEIAKRIIDKRRAGV